ncbi:helix-turn-helix domain-containing protein [Bosea caraganae]|uniref:helix-turn-helix domain-containing protein n=1 Tax=Bosea caraganae TaxID=2763117 RepID=UPI0015F0B4B1|nr:helix-turn-helix domain-containing protein [Bosea caraganae]
MFDVASHEPDKGFLAESTVWTFGGFGLSHVKAPSLRASRSNALVRRNPVDHWVITLGQHVTTGLGGGVSLNVPPRIPFVVSLGREMVSQRAHDERLQLYLPRDSFGDLAPVLDAMQGQALDKPLGKLLGDYIGLLQRNASELSQADLPRLTNAVRSMVLACIAPTVDHSIHATSLIDLSRREKARQVIERHLRQPSLGPATLCREMGMSRTQLYRLLHDEGGVARFIQRRRLLQSYAELSDPLNRRSITVIAETLCFQDASSFSRAFRQEFGMTPRDVRAAWSTGQALALPSDTDPDAEFTTLRQCLGRF